MEVHHVFKGIITACMNGKESVQDPKMLWGPHTLAGRKQAQSFSIANTQLPFFKNDSED